jgi:uncharacterized protein YmfQ (DUF2313 family)
MITPFGSLADSDFAGAVADLLPRGRAWPRTNTALMTALAQAIADGLYTFHAAAVNFLETESFPATASALLPNFETDYALPDPCSLGGATTAQLLAKIASIGGQSAAYFIGVANALGYTHSVSVTTFTPFLLGEAHWGDPICGWQWWFGWQVNAKLIDGPGTDLSCRLGVIGPATGVVWVNMS